FSFAFPGPSRPTSPTNHCPLGTTPNPSGVPFTVYGVNNVPDLHGDPFHANLVLFVAGNQFMVMPELISAFKKRYPEVRHVFYETSPPESLLARSRKEV
ncbi:sulfate-binding protein, partial [mine drainage metagenome]